MSKSCQICCLSLFFYVLFPPGLLAQPAQKDSLITNLAYNNALRQYHEFLTPEPGLYRGFRYVEYGYQLAEGHPYFGDGDMHKGVIWYNGILYENMLISYDMVKDQVVINSPFESYRMFLISNQVDSFTIGDHSFVRLRDSLNPTAPRIGFYEQLSKGRVSLLKKDIKYVREEIQTMEVRRFIDSAESYYVKKNDTYYFVGNRKTMLRAFKDRSKDLIKFIRQNKLSVRHDLENTLIKVSAWYNDLQ